MTLGVPDCAVNDLNNLILVTGAPRSGTTLLGKIVSTLSPVEYHFEPPTFYMICAMVAAGELTSGAAAAIARIYLYEDLLLESVHGRKVNLRPEDDSMILNAIAWPDLLRRWGSVENREGALRAIRERGVRLAVKMPNVMDAADWLFDVFVDIQLLLVIRDGREVVRSILGKGWVADKALHQELWPYRSVDGRRVPYWVEVGAEHKWLDMNETTRACYMWRRHARLALHLLQGRAADDRRVLRVNYSRLLSHPDSEVGRISNWLGVSQTSHTRRRLEEIQVPVSMSSDIDLEDFFPQVERSELSLFLEVNEALLAT